MASQLRTLATLTEDLGSVLSIHTTSSTRGSDTFSELLKNDTHVHGALMHTQAKTDTRKSK